MELNLLTLIYLFLRLAPFILVCFFTLSSIIEQNLKGFVYLVGLLVACGANLMLGGVFGAFIGEPNRNLESVCSTFTLGKNQLFSNLPMGICTLAYTFAFLLFAIVKYNLVLQNIPTIVIFPIFLLSDMIWNFSNGCYGVLNILFALGVGAGIGILWAFIIDYTKMSSLQYFSLVTNSEVCSRPSNQTFRCQFYKRGEKIN
jgi:hypothetical protein